MHSRSGLPLRAMCRDVCCSLRRSVQHFSMPLISILAESLFIQPFHMVNERLPARLAAAAFFHILKVIRLFVPRSRPSGGYGCKALIFQPKG